MASLIPALLLSAGSPIKGYDYEHFVLGGELEIIGWGSTELNLIRNHEPMPTEYLLARESYRLRAQVDLRSIPPSIIFSVEGERLSDLKISASHIRCFVKVEPIRPDEVKKYALPKDGLRFTWIPVAKFEPCNGATLDVSEFEVSVYRGDSLIGKELIPFEIRSNGIRYEIDAP